MRVVFPSKGFGRTDVPYAHIHTYLEYVYANIHLTFPACFSQVSGHVCPCQAKLHGYMRKQFNPFSNTSVWRLPDVDLGVAHVLVFTQLSSPKVLKQVRNWEPPKKLAVSQRSKDTMRWAWWVLCRIIGALFPDNWDAHLWVWQETISIHRLQLLV